MLRPLACILALCLTLSLAACSGEETTTGNKAAKDSTNVTLTIGVMPSMDYLPLAIAEREGYFDELGVDVTIQLFFSANERDAAFQSNSIDGTVIDYTGAIIQHASGTELCLASRCDAPFYLLASPASGITTVEGLKHHSIAISQNTVIDYLVDQALSRAHVPESDITRVEINRIPIRYEMLTNNKVDATGLPNPFALLAEKSGATILTSNNDMQLSITGIMFTKTAVQSKADQIRLMYQAYDKGVAYLKEHPVSDYEDILVERFGYTKDILGDTSTPAASADTATNNGIPAYELSALPDEGSITEVTAWLKKRGLIHESYDPKTAGLLDGQFLPR